VSHGRRPHYDLKYLFIFFLSFTYLSKKKVEALSIVSHGRSSHYDLQYLFNFFLVLQNCLKKELRPLALCLMAAGHIMIYNIYQFFFSFTNLSKNRVEALSIVSHGRRPHYDLQYLFSFFLSFKNLSKKKS
jgi:hypothetical protein